MKVSIDVDGDDGDEKTRGRVAGVQAAEQRRPPVDGVKLPAHQDQDPDPGRQGGQRQGKAAALHPQRCCHQARGSDILILFVCYVLYTLDISTYKTCIHNSHSLCSEYSR